MKWRPGYLYAIVHASCEYIYGWFREQYLGRRTVGYHDDCATTAASDNAVA